MLAFRPRALLALAALSLPLAAAALADSPAPVDNFALLDQHGRFHELYCQRDRRAVVLFVPGNGFPIARKALPPNTTRAREGGGTAAGLL